MIRPLHISLIAYWILIGCGALTIIQAQPLAHSTHMDTGKIKPAYQGYSLEQLKAIRPKSPNPYLSLLPTGVMPDMAYWRAWMRAEARVRRSVQIQRGRPIVIEESEPNNSPDTGNPINGFGSGPGQAQAVDVWGDFPESATGTPIPAFMEDDGAIPLASDPGLSTGQRLTVAARIGDGPHGSRGTQNGDFDFYAISGVTAGQIIIAAITTPPSDLPALDSVLVVWDGAGNMVASNDDDPARPGTTDSLVNFLAPKDGTYYVSVGSFDSPAPTNPFDSSSGTGVSTEGPYELTLGLEANDVDFFTIALKAGDVLNVNGLGAIAYVSLFDPSGRRLITSHQDITPVLPDNTPFAAGDNPSLVYVIDRPGTYAVRVTGLRTGIYLAELRIARPPLDAVSPDGVQILFIDFDGAVVDMELFEGFGRRLLSPLRHFLGNWGG